MNEPDYKLQAYAPEDREYLSEDDIDPDYFGPLRIRMNAYAPDEDDL